MHTTETRIQEKLTELEISVTDLKNSSLWKDWLKFSAKITNYSFLNNMMIKLQRLDATYVMAYGNKAGTSGWKSVGRQVQKGETSIKIFAPLLRKNENGVEEPYGFRAVSVFDVAQTEGDPIPEAPDWPEPTQCPEHLFNALVSNCPSDLSVVIETKETLGSSRGNLKRDKNQITILNADEPLMVSTLLHELGHLFDPFLIDTPHLYPSHRGDCELVAESVMWLVSQKAGIDSDDEVNTYLASWSGKDVDLLKLSKRIQESYIEVDRILTKAREQL